MTKSKTIRHLVVDLGRVATQTKGSLGTKYVDDNQQKRDIPMLAQD